MVGEKTKFNAFPVFLGVEMRRIVVVGNGEPALIKARLVAQSSARICVVADRPHPNLRCWLGQSDVEHVEAPYTPDQLDGAVLVFSATGNLQQDTRIVGDARMRGIPVNAVDRPHLCDFFTPAIVNRAPVMVAIGTEGTAPVLALMIRAQIEKLLSPALGSLAALAQTYRIQVSNMLTSGAPRRKFWRNFFGAAPLHAAAHSDWFRVHDMASQLLRAASRSNGHVAFVDAGMGESDLLSLRAHRHLLDADVILHDRNMPGDILSIGRRDAERLSVPDLDRELESILNEEAQLLVSLATSGRQVVHLFNGDRDASSRCAIHRKALQAAGIEHILVPGPARINEQSHQSNERIAA